MTIDESVAPVVDLVLDVVACGRARTRVPTADRRRAAASTSDDVLALRVDHDPLAAPGGADPDVEPFVVVDEDLDVVVLRGADAVAHHPVRAFLFVGLDVAQVGAVARPGDAGPRGVGDLVVEVVLVGDVADSQRVVLVAAGVGRPGHEPVVGAHLERAEVEELVAGGLGVLVEHELVRWPSSADVPRQWIGYDCPSSVRAE